MHTHGQGSDLQLEAKALAVLALRLRHTHHKASATRRGMTDGVARRAQQIMGIGSIGQSSGRGLRAILPSVTRSM